MMDLTNSAGRASEAAHAARPTASTPIARIRLPLTGVLAATLLLITACETQTDYDRMYELYEETREFQLQENPVRASARGELEANDELRSMTMEDLERRHDYWTGVLEELRALDYEGMPGEHQISYDLFERSVEKRVRDHEFRDYLTPINHEQGFHTGIVGLENQVPLDSVSHYEDYIARLNAFPEYFGQHIDLMRTGLEEGYTLPSAVLPPDYTQTITMHMVDDPAQSSFYEPFLDFPEAVPEAERDRLRQAGAEAIAQSVVPAYDAFLEFMEDEYMPGARERISVTGLPGGEAYYEYLIDYFTTLDLTAREIHGIGMDEVERIRGEMMDVIDETGFEGSFDAFVQFLRTDPQFYVDEDDPKQLLKEASYHAKRMDGKLPELFNTLPRQPYGVEPVPDHLAPRYTTGRYSSGGENEAGYYWVNLYNAHERPLYNLEALTYHEGVPGHHLQNALQQEQDLPVIRRREGITAFSEGWGLYSERLGLDAGFYDDPYSDFGRLNYEMWRAVRLVVDTGMHALGWSRERAFEFMLENTALPELEVDTEINRYIAWPGQALAYKLGEIKIRELREEAEQELGADFDIGEFHDVVLLEGEVPLDVLEEHVHEYIEENR